MNERRLKIKEKYQVCRQIWFLLLTFCWAKLRCIWLFCFCALIVVVLPLHRGRRVSLAMQVLQFIRFLVAFPIKSGQHWKGKTLHDISQK